MTEQAEIFVAPDGSKWRVCKDPPEPSSPLLLSSGEERALESAIRNMAKRFRRESIPLDNIREALKSQEPGHVWIHKALDKIVADTLTSLKIDIPEEPAEKLFDRLGRVSADWGDDAGAVGVLFYRYYDTMEAMVSYKKKFRGKELRHFKYTKEEALQVLRQRGLARR